MDYNSALLPLRDEVCLNGVWDNDAVVPCYVGIPQFDQQDFGRTVTVPASWAGKRVRLEFGAIAFSADVYVNGIHVASHVGAWTPFSVDLSELVAPGESFALRVNVKGPKHPPITDAEGHVQWPVGGWYGGSRGGIIDDVYLRAYGPVAVEDAFIQTSVRESTLSVLYTLRNATAAPVTVTVNGAVSRTGRDRVAFRLCTPPVTLAPGEVKEVQASGVWGDPEYWWPDSPTLYYLRSEVVSAGQVIDAETRRFGFREIWIDGTQFRLNGVRANLFGDYQVFGDTWYTTPALYTPEAWPDTVDRIKYQNIRILRFHHNPVPKYILDVCDEKGLMICSESPNYARNYHNDIDRDAYLDNCHKWLPGWIKAERNHPCIYMWNATNEMTFKGMGHFDPAALRRLGDTIKRYDPTRPVGYDGDDTVNGELVDYHYPEGYNREPSAQVILSGPSQRKPQSGAEPERASIYTAWNSLLRPDKPVGTGECLHTKSPLPEVQTAVARNTWWLGIWLRGLRYSNWTNVKPACFWFAINDYDSVRATNMRNAYAPVALFDKEYDDFGIAPYVTGLTPGGTLPVVQAGARLERTLILYNDEFRGTRITAEVVVRAQGREWARAERAFTVPLGEHVEIPYTLCVPPVAGSEMEVVLRTYKDGVKKFEEVRRFQVAANEGDAAPCAVVIGAAAV